MIELRAPATDEDYEAWRRVRLAVLPNERTQTVEELRAGPPERRLLVAYLDGELAGAGVTARSDTGGAFVQPRVLPRHRRRGVGSALLRALADHALAAGHAEAGAHVEEADALGFAERFGFRETDRQVEQVRAIGPDEAAPQPPPARRSRTSPSTARSSSMPTRGRRNGSATPTVASSRSMPAARSSGSPASSWTPTVPTAPRTP